MASVAIRTEGDKTDFAPGERVVLTAKSSEHAAAYQWQLAGVPIPGATSTEYEFRMTPDKTGDYVVVATVSGVPVSSPPLTLKLAPATPPPSIEESQPAAAAETPPVMHLWFAIVAGLVSVVVVTLVLVGLNLFNGRGGMADAAWTALEGRLKFALALTSPLVVLGTILLLAGMWMAVVEWRGRFVDEPKAGPVTKGDLPFDVGKLVDAIGKLHGATLVVVVGAILLIASAWVGQSAAGTAPAPSASTGAGATPSSEQSQSPTAPAGG